MIKNRTETLEDLVEKYKRKKGNYSTYEFDELSYRTLILDIHTMLKENKKYKEVINKAINYINNNIIGIDIKSDNIMLNRTELLDILKEVEHE